MVSRPGSGDLQPEGVRTMSSAIASPQRTGMLLLCHPLWDAAIATEGPPVAIPEQIRCKTGRLGSGAASVALGDH